ncbi:MAG: malto-oligosyltrehalose trehalohydrolase [Elusimicrobia bacterium]|nr:malto-oligosyltrehalose trehalohydrolase [Elusimicrobiota bacterium]
MRTRTSPARRLAAGAEYSPGRGVHFRVWAPERRRVRVVFEDDAGGETPGPELEAEDGGCFSGSAPDARPGTLYRFRLDGEGPFPDPASRFQPRGPHGPSQVVDPGAYPWRDASWRGPRREGRVLYELHVGTFTREGTWEAASRRLQGLADLGVTVIEVMPVADFPGRFGWGYDGVNLYAPTRLYGSPDDFRAFVDRAHGRGLAVILDVVYNHFGPDGNYLGRFSSRYTKDEATDWGPAINFDGADSGPVREYFASNAAYWISEYHLDGLRLDATHAIRDSSPVHVLAEAARAARAAAGRRPIVVFAENEDQEARLARPAAAGGCGLDALWNDDFHHSARVALTGRREAYYSGYLGAPQEFISCLMRGFLYQGQFFKWHGKRRGTPAADLPPSAFIHYLENHDQVSTSLGGRRLGALADPGRRRAMTAVLLLGPQTPLLFQGQEFDSSAPFLYFADHAGTLGAAVREGRKAFLARFPSMAAPEVQAALEDPGDPSTFERCKLDDAERTGNAAALALHRDLLRLRREEPFRSQGSGGLAGAVLGAEAFAVRFWGARGDDRLLVVNLGGGLDLAPAPEPLLAPPGGGAWETHWSSELPAYGGAGASSPVDREGRWRLPAACATLLRGAAREEAQP